MGKKENKTSIKLGSATTFIFFIVLFVLKVAEIGVVANWSWIWIFAPLWVPATIVLMFIILIILVKIFK